MRVARRNRLRIGYARDDYANRRNIIGRVPDAEYRRAWDALLVGRAMWKGAHSLTSARAFDPQRWMFRFNDLGITRVDVLHLFNFINYSSSTPWLTTFETMVPRFAETLLCHHGEEPDYSQLRACRPVVRALERLADDSCAGVIALSRSAETIQTALLEAFPEYAEGIRRKLSVLHPPQAPLIKSIEHKRLWEGGPLRMIFVGHLFFRKGGIEMLETLAHLRKTEGHDIHLTIVSSLQPDEFAEPDRTRHVDAARHLINENAHWISHHAQLSNTEVLERLLHSHVGLLPTYAETYGYSVLEMQAAGCATVTTNVRALPEINDSSTGWLLNVPTNPLGEGLYVAEEDRDRAGRAIRRQLAVAVRSMFEDPQSVSSKGSAALDRIEAYHSLEAYGETLAQLYAPHLK